MKLRKKRAQRDANTARWL